ncbi:stage 0 sporulation protein YaaT-like protein [Streptococcus equi subsp. zooepidemicus ATCC 35246]|nr:stage 0 sporulation protein YaaT-like protein [Streptococcus equi subsp. zooepidemicus ATCC 35246]
MWSLSLAGLKTEGISFGRSSLLKLFIGELTTASRLPLPSDMTSLVCTGKACSV